MIAFLLVCILIVLLFGAPVVLATISIVGLLLICFVAYTMLGPMPFFLLALIAVFAGIFDGKGKKKASTKKANTKKTGTTWSAAAYREKCAQRGIHLPSSGSKPASLPPSDNLASWEVSPDGTLTRKEPPAQENPVQAAPPAVKKAKSGLWYWLKKSFLNALSLCIAAFGSIVIAVLLAVFMEIAGIIASNSTEQHPLLLLGSILLLSFLIFRYVGSRLHARFLD